MHSFDRWHLNFPAAAIEKCIFSELNNHGRQELAGLFFFFSCFFKIVPEPLVAVLTNGPFVVRVGQHLLAQGAALCERLLVHLFPDVANQDLEERG